MSDTNDQPQHSRSPYDQPRNDQPRNEREHLSPGEIRKHALQEGFDATASAVGQVGGLVLGTVRDVGRTVGNLATELFEIRSAARRAANEHRDDADG